MMNFIEQYGYLSIFILIAVENIFPPIPSEVILAFGGFITTHTSMTPIGVTLTATAGSVMGAVILYKIGTLLNARKLERLIDGYGRILSLRSKDVHKAFSFFKRYKNSAVFICRMIPIIRSLISIPAGMARMNFKVFVLLTALGTLLWNLLLVSAGAFLGESWVEVMSFVEIYKEITYIIIALAGAVYIGYKVISKYKNK
jgi:membrane protein DedA with SNARE-associated domain